MELASELGIEARTQGVVAKEQGQGSEALDDREKGRKTTTH